MKNFLKELTKGFRWVLVALLILIVLVAGWVGAAWLLGWAVNHFFDLRHFSSANFISFGSCTLVFMLIIQIITIIITGWAMLAYGRSRGIINKEKSK